MMLRLILLPILFPVALIFSFFSFLRRKLYDWNWFTIHKLPVKIISVGNITSGGTGKTPIVRWVVEGLKARGQTVCVLSRGYGRSSDFIEQVTSDNVKTYGDEPVQLSRQLVDIPVYVGSDRAAAVRKIIDEIGPDFVVLDDGFQHRRLHRDVDLVVLDCTQPRWNYLPLPLGYGREGFGALNRASLVLLSRYNYLRNDQGPWFSERIQRYPAVKLDFQLESARAGEDRISLVQLKSKRVALITAIGRPEFFERQIRDLGCRVELHKKFPDHHGFESSEVDEFQKRCIKKNVDYILCTEKDFVKLKNFDLKNLIVIEMKIKPQNGNNELNDLLDRLTT